jgi:hypothetical protein
MNSDKTGTVWGSGMGYFAFLGLRLACLCFLCIALALCACLSCARVYIGVDAVNGTRFTCFDVPLVSSGHSGSVEAPSSLYRGVGLYSVLYAPGQLTLARVTE